MLIVLIGGYKERKMLSPIKEVNAFVVVMINFMERWNFTIQIQNKKMYIGKNYDFVLGMPLLKNWINVYVYVPTVIAKFIQKFARRLVGMAELVDAPGLGSGVFMTWRFKSSYRHSLE